MQILGLKGLTLSSELQTGTVPQKLMVCPIPWTRHPIEMNSPYMAWGNVKILKIIEINLLSSKLREGRLATQPYY